MVLRLVINIMVQRIIPISIVCTSFVESSIDYRVIWTSVTSLLDLKNIESGHWWTFGYHYKTLSLLQADLTADAVADLLIPQLILCKIQGQASSCSICPRVVLQQDQQESSPVRVQKRDLHHSPEIG